MKINSQNSANTVGAASAAHAQAQLNETGPDAVRQRRQPDGMHHRLRGARRGGRQSCDAQAVAGLHVKADRKRGP